MFGLGKKKIDVIWKEIAVKLRNISTFQRYSNDGRFPEHLKNNHYVLGYHFMMALNLYIVEIKGKVNTEEQGFVLTNSLSLALEMDASTVGGILEPLMANPDIEFTKGTEDANEAFEMLEQNNELAFAKFNNAIKFAGIKFK